MTTQNAKIIEEMESEIYMDKNNNTKRVPLILITGYLGSGKTTLLNELLSQDKRKIALIVNDMGSINIDAKLLGQRNVQQMDTKMVELSNGCICCTLRDEFMNQVEEISKDKDVEAVFVEASGISDPASIAEGFIAYKEVRTDSRVYLSSIVTVVDADRINREFLAGLKEAEDAQSDETDDDDADIINLVMDQIEFCNKIILNKCDLVSKDELDEIKGVIHKLQPKAEIIQSVMGKVDIKLIINAGEFDYDSVLGSSMIQRALDSRNSKGKMDSKEGCTDEYGVSSFVYEEKRPFNYDKLMSFISDDYPETIIRAKGYIWFAEDDIHVQLFEQAGRNASVTELSNWVAAFPKEDRQEVFDNYPEVLESWDDKYGDRSNQIVFIGKDYDQDEIINKLNQCIEGN